jgi:hypothetical protein
MRKLSWLDRYASRHPWRMSAVTLVVTMVVLGVFLYSMYLFMAYTQTSGSLR